LECIDVSQAFSVDRFEETKDSNEVTERFWRDRCKMKDFRASRRLGSKHEARVANCALH